MVALARRLLVPLTLATAVALVVAWFPLSTLLSQRHQIATVSRQISTLERDAQRVTAERREISSTAAETELARAEYQLVKPGERLIQILNGGPGTSPIGTGDPGDQPLASPAAANGLLPATPTTPNRGAATRPGFWSRVVRTLEFWR